MPFAGCSAKQVLELGSSSLSNIDCFLVLPQELDQEAQDGKNVPKKTEDDKPMIDYSKSITFTSKTFMNAIAVKANHKEATLHESGQKRARLEETNVQRKAKKEICDAIALLRAEERIEKKKLEAYWKRVKDAR